MTIVLSDATVKEIISLLGVKEPEYTDIYLTDEEIEALFKLSQANKSSTQRVQIRTSGRSGIGTTVKVIIKGKETDITDYDSW